MSRLKLIVPALFGLFFASLLAAQTPPAADPQPAPPAAEPQAAPPAAQPPAAPPVAAAPRPVLPTPALEPENTWHLDLSTGGRVSIQLRPDMAPNHVERVKTLTRQGFYNGLAFFRVVEGFMGQSGDPANTGTGGSPLPNLERELGLAHLRGAVGAARTNEPNTANSQFYIMFLPQLTMDRQYTVFGRVVSGMNFVDTLERGEPPLAPSRIVRASLGSDNLAPMTAEQLRAEEARLAAAAPAPAAAQSRVGAVGPAVPRAPAAPRALEPARAPNAPPRPPRQ